MKINTKEIIERGFIKEHEVEEVMKDNRLTKVMLSDIRGDIESIWCSRLLKTEESSFVVLANHAVAMMPAHSWGLVIEAKPDSEGRLEARMEDQDERISEAYQQYFEHWKHMF